MILDEIYELGDGYSPKWVKLIIEIEDQMTSGCARWCGTISRLPIRGARCAYGHIGGLLMAVLRPDYNNFYNLTTLSGRSQYSLLLFIPNISFIAPSTPDPYSIDTPSKQPPSRLLSTLTLGLCQSHQDSSNNLSHYIHSNIF